VKFYLLIILFFTVSCTQIALRKSQKISILQGVTNSKEVEFSIVAQGNRPLRFEMRDETGTILEPEEIKTVTRDFSPFAVHKVLFARDPIKTYNLYVFEGEKIVDQRLVGMGQRESSKLRLAVVSCLNDFSSGHFKIWDALSGKNPEYLLMIGDNVYADYKGPSSPQSTNPEILWNRYVETRLKLPFYFKQKLIPTHGLWDDHDYGANNSNSNFTHKDASKEIFDAFFAQDLSEDDWTKGLGVGGLLSLGDFNLYFLDGRTFRSPDKKQTHLGLDQSAWFYSKLREESNPSIIIKGDQFFGGHHPFESFEGSHPDHFLQFVAELKKISTPFIFASGDRHLSEIMQFPRSLFGKPSFEITSSPLHARTFGPGKEQNPWRVVGEMERVNFTIIDNVAKDNHWFLDIENFGETGDLHYRREVAVYIKDLQDNLAETRKRRSGKRRYRRIRSKRR
jgi:hypothetical protein